MNQRGLKWIKQAELGVEVHLNRFINLLYKSKCLTMKYIQILNFVLIDILIRVCVPLCMAKLFTWCSYLFRALTRHPQLSTITTRTTATATRTNTPYCKSEMNANRKGAESGERQRSWIWGPLDGAVRDAKVALHCCQLFVYVFVYLSPCRLVASAISAHYCCNQADKGFAVHGTQDTSLRFMRVLILVPMCTPCAAYQ